MPSAFAYNTKLDGNDYDYYYDGHHVIPNIDAILEANPDYNWYYIRRFGAQYTLTLMTTQFYVNDSGDTMYWTADGTGIIYNAAIDTDTWSVGDWVLERSFTYSQNGWNSGPAETPIIYTNFDIYTKSGNFYDSYSSPMPCDDAIIYRWSGDIADTTDNITDIWYKVDEFTNASNAYAVYGDTLYTDFYYEDDGDWCIANGVTDQDIVVTSSLNGIYLVRNSDELYCSLLILFPKKAEYRVTLPGNPDGYVVTSANGSTLDVIEGGSYSFNVTIFEGYEADSDFAVKANGVTLTAVNGLYTISNITTDQTITVTGVAKTDTGDSGEDTGDDTGNTDSSCSCVDGIRAIIEDLKEALTASMNQQVLDMVLNISERFSIITDAISAQTESLVSALDSKTSLINQQIAIGVEDITDSIKSNAITNASTIANSFANSLSAAVDDITLTLNGNNSTTTTAIDNAANSIIAAIANINISTDADEEEVKTDSKPLWEQFKDVYKESDDDTTINISAEDIFGLKHITKLITDLIDTGSDIGDLGTIVSNDHTYRWFSAEIAADIDSVGTPPIDDDESAFDRLNREFNEIYFPERVGESA